MCYKLGFVSVMWFSYMLFMWIDSDCIKREFFICKYFNEDDDNFCYGNKWDEIYYIL